jgi:hypothetical protein
VAGEYLDDQNQESENESVIDREEIEYVPYAATENVLAMSMCCCIRSMFISSSYDPIWISVSIVNGCPEPSDYQPTGCCESKLDLGAHSVAANN